MALGDKTTSYINELINAGADALSNLYYLYFTGGEFNDNLINSALKVRAGDFTPPTFSQTVDTKNFMTVSIDLPKPEIQGDKSFSITFRVDDNFEVYQALVNQRKKVVVSNLGYINPNLINNNTFTIKVFTYKPWDESNMAGVWRWEGEAGRFTEIYEFRKCWIKSLNGLTFSYEGSTPLTVTAEIGFQDFDDPENKFEEK